MKAQDTETKILKAAEHEFMTKGYAGARTTSIAKAAGVTHAMLHYYFRTKEKLFDRIITEKIELLKNAFLQPLTLDNLSVMEKIRNFIEQHLDFVAANPDLPRFLVVEVFSNEELMASLKSKILSYAPLIMADFQRQLDNAAAKGEIRQIDVKDLVLDIISLNIFPFVGAPLIDAVFGNYDVFAPVNIAKRKQENYQTILRKLTPQQR